MAKTDDKADVWMPLYIGDYLADTSRLTTEQHGAYFLLMMDYWRNGPPPDDEEILQNITRLSKFLWKKHGTVLRKFFTVEDGVWNHKRIDSELSQALSGKAAASDKARKAAEARWGKQDAQSMPQADAPEMLEECPSQSQSPSPLEQPKNLEGDTHTGGTPVRASDLSSAMRRHSIEAQPGDPRIIAAAAAGISVATVEAACLQAKESKPNERIPPYFVIKIAENWTREAATPRPKATAGRPAFTNARDESRKRAYEVLTGKTPADQSEVQPAEVINGHIKLIG